MFGWFRKKASPQTPRRETDSAREAEKISPITARQETELPGEAETISRINGLCRTARINAEAVARYRASGLPPISSTGTSTTDTRNFVPKPLALPIP